MRSGVLFDGRFSLLFFKLSFGYLSAIPKRNTGDGISIVGHAICVFPLVKIAGERG